MQTRFVFIAAIWLGSMASAAAEALSCSQYLNRIQALDAADLVPELGMRENAHSPTVFAITGLHNIDAGIECRDGEFQGLDFTLTSSGEPDRMRWAIFSSLAVAATSSSGSVSEASSLVTELLDEAVSNAKTEEIRSGFRTGFGETDYYGTTVSVAVGMGNLSVRIDPESEE